MAWCETGTRRAAVTDRPELADTSDLHIPNISSLSQSREGRMLENSVGVRRYFMAAPLEESSELLVAVGLPYDRVVRETNFAFYRTLAGLAILTLFTIVAVFIAAELGILRGIRSLARVAQRFGAGEFSVRRKDHAATMSSRRWPRRSTRWPTRSKPGIATQFPIKPDCGPSRADHPSA